MPHPRTLLPQLKAMGLSPRKGLGQHYLTDPNILVGIVTAAELPPDAVVIEVGPGPGTLTAELAHRAGRLVSVELDTRLAPLLADLYADEAHVHIVQGDVLTLSPDQLLNSIRDQLLTLPDDTVVWPGHGYGGEHSTIGAEKAGNPFINGGW